MRFFAWQQVNEKMFFFRKQIDDFESCPIKEDFPEVQSVLVGPKNSEGNDLVYRASAQNGTVIAFEVK